MRGSLAPRGFLAWLFFGLSSLASGDVELEYVGHACFVARDPSALPQAAALVREAYQSGDEVAFAFQWASALHQSARNEEAIPVLEAALARAQRDDWEYRMRAHSLLAELYQARGLEREAAEQHRIVLRSGYRTDLVEKSRAYLSQKRE